MHPITTLKRLIRADMLGPEIVIIITLPAGAIIAGAIGWMLDSENGPWVMIAAIVALGCSFFAVGLVGSWPGTREILDRYDPAGAEPDGPETGR